MGDKAEMPVDLPYVVRADEACGSVLALRFEAEPEVIIPAPLRVRSGDAGRLAGVGADELSESAQCRLIRAVVDGPEPGDHFGDDLRQPGGR